MNKAYRPYRLFQSHGFIISSLPFLLTLILTLFSVIFATFYILRFQHKSQYLCRQQVLKAQTTMGKALQDLLKLNQPAKILNIAHKNLNYMQNLSIVLLSPHLFKIFSHFKKVILLLKKQLKIWQKIIIHKGYLAASFQLQQFVILFYKWIRKDSSLWFKERSRTFSSARFKRTKLAVKPHKKSKQDVAIYKVIKNFSEKQKITAEWFFSFRTTKIGWLFSKLPKTHLKSNCTATLIQRNNKWVPILY